MPAAERFAILVDEFAGRPGVAVPDPTGRGFGSDALKVNGSIFAMVSADRLVMKLPRSRVEALIQTGEGLPFDAGKGRPMKEWVVVDADDPEACVALAREALEFVASRPKRG